MPYVTYGAVVVAAAVAAGDRTAQLLILAASSALLELMGIAYSVRAAVHRGLTPAQRQPWRSVAAAFALVILSSTGFAVAVTSGATGLSPVYLAAVVLRLAYTAALLRAMYLFSAPQIRTRHDRWMLQLDAITVMGLGVAGLWYFLIGPAIATGAGDLAQVLLSVTPFAILDLVLAFGVCAVLLRGVAPVGRLPVMLLLAAAIGNLIVDTLVGRAQIQRVQTEAVIGTVWHTVWYTLPVFLLLAAATEQCRQAGRDRSHLTPKVSRQATWLPYAAVVAGIALLLAAGAQAPANPWWGLFAGATIMAIGVTMRQYLTLRENQRLVATDSLTGLANRLQLNEAMTRLARRHELVALLQIDLDGFKGVNDIHGHDTGDAYLIAFADVVRRTLRRGDLAARLGGDEFVVLLGGVYSVDDAVGVAERILERAERPAIIAGHEFRIHASVGIAIARSGELDPEQLLHRADQAMYAAKRRRTHGWQLYAEADLGDDEESMRHMIAEAVPAGQLRLVYQPIVALATGDLVALEALIRWHHPTRGLLPPAEFLPTAEETGAITEISAWVIDEASRHVAAWHRSLPTGRTLRLSVNLSPRHLATEHLADDVLTILRRNGLPPTDFVVEVTESGLVPDAIRQLEALRAAGVRIALDDFGTGYSSLRSLTRLPVDMLKLDRSFVGELDGGPEGSAVAEAVVRLAHMLNLDTVAEGIEEPAQATELTLRGYRNAQGFYFSRPVPADDISEMIENNTGWPNLSPSRPAPAGGGDPARASVARR